MLTSAPQTMVKCYFRESDSTPPTSAEWQWVAPDRAVTGWTTEADLGSILAAEPRFSLDLELVTSNGSDDRPDGTISLTGKLESLERPLIGSYSRIANCDGDNNRSRWRRSSTGTCQGPPPSARQGRTTCAKTAPRSPTSTFSPQPSSFNVVEVRSKEYEPHRGDDPVALRYSPDSP
jgi:hypothetical protein